MCTGVNLVQTSARLLRMFRRPAHGPQVDVVLLAACAWVPSLVTRSILKEILLAISHCSRDHDGAVVTWSPTGIRGSLPKIEVVGIM